MKQANPNSHLQEQEALNNLVDLLTSLGIVENPEQQFSEPLQKIREEILQLESEIKADNHNLPENQDIFLMSNYHSNNGNSCPQKYPDISPKNTSLTNNSSDITESQLLISSQNNYSENQDYMIQKYSQNHESQLTVNLDPNYSDSQIVPLEPTQSQEKKPNCQSLNSEQTEQILEIFSLNKETDYLDIQESHNREQTDHELDSKLQDLLTNLLLSDSEKQIKKLEESINKIEYKLHDPEELIQLLLPLIADLLSLKVEESREEVITAIVPIIDQVLNQRIHQDKEAMITAISSIIPGSISKQIGESPEEVIHAIAPAMGKAIKEQIIIERDSMVDALYPVIGNTISKYMGEVIQQINQRVENTLTPEGISRKIRAKLQGVSEAELILRESMPFIIRAIFLIHKASGLVMSEAQQNRIQPLESDLLAGMLTAIRDFGGQCSIQPGNVSELTEIEYENFKIVMEVAGYCYIAIIAEGEPNQAFIKEMRQTLSNIILSYGHGNIFQNFNGDPETIPTAIHALLDALLNYRTEEFKQRKFPKSLLILLTIFLGVITAFTGFKIYRYQVSQNLINLGKIALASRPELALYKLNLEIANDTINLTGNLPNEYLRSLAFQVTQEALPNREINNQILAVNLPPDPFAIQSEIQRLTAMFNQNENVIINTNYQNHQLQVEGYIRNQKKAQEITKAFQSIPGIESVVITLQAKAFPIDQRIYFNYNSARLNPRDLEGKIRPITQFLEQYPDMKINIIGHADPTGDESRNQILARERAIAVKKALEDQGIEADRLEIAAMIQLPPGINPYYPLWFGRCVRFERIISDPNSD
jgi:outer membrane protein OmpA-like peptidoglycan-associated protein